MLLVSILKNMWFKVSLVILLYFYCVSLALKPRLRDIMPRRKATPGYRLPKNVQILNQQVTLEPSLDTFSFTGTTTINGVFLTNTTDQIILHSKDLIITNYTIEIDASVITNEVTLSFDVEKEFIILALSRFQNEGAHFRLNFTFSGILNDDRRGFYRASYLDEYGERRWFAVTQSESTFARMIFPCFDEPSFKTIFSVTITAKNNYTVLANSNLLSSVNRPNGYTNYVFNNTPIMASYIFAAAVSDLQNVSSDGHSVYAKPQAIFDGRGNYSLTMSHKILDTMELYTYIKYPLNKIHQIAVPDDYFTFGAMENWGLVVYRERLLLYKENVSTTAEKQDIATIIAHEYAHQWFGNLVTPEWWSYIWLNEGFATFFEYYLIDILEPSWRVMEQFNVETLQNALYVDSLDTTRPMTFDAGTPEEIDALFDDIAYAKAGSVIRMMEHIVTSEVFREGLYYYLLTLSYNNTNEDKLYENLQLVLNMHPITLEYELSNIMKSWTNQSGYPVVTVSRNSDGSITVSQERFLLYNTSSEPEQLWYIPINYALSNNFDFNNTNPTFWLVNEAAVLNVTVPFNSWIIVNNQQTGYYRVNYDFYNWELITNFLRSPNFTSIHVLNRAQLLDDAFNLARSGRLYYDVVLNLIRYIEQETDYIPLYSFFQGITYLDRILAETIVYDEFRVYVISLLENVYTNLTTYISVFDGHIDRRNRINVLNWMCKLGYEDCLEKMKAKLNSLQDIDPDLQTPVYCGGMRNGSENELNILLDLHLSLNTEQYQRTRIANGLGCTTNTTVLQRLLSMSLQNQTAELFTAVYSGTNVGAKLAFDYLINNFENIKTVFSREQVASILNGVSVRLTTVEELEKYNSFVDSLDIATLQEFYYNLYMARKTIERNIEWLNLYQNQIIAWFFNSKYTFKS